MLAYKMNLHLSAEDFDKNGQIRLGALLYYFQDAAARHADEMGIGYDRGRSDLDHYKAALPDREPPEP